MRVLKVEPLRGSNWRAVGGGGLFWQYQLLFEGGFQIPPLQFLNSINWQNLCTVSV